MRYLDLYVSPLTKASRINEYVELESFFFPLNLCQELYEVSSIPFKSTILYGSPGGGKSLIASRLIPALMSWKYPGMKAEVIYQNLGDYSSNPSDFKYYALLKNNNLIYEKSQLSKKNEEANSSDSIFCVNIFDEVSRISNTAQNLLLPVTEDNSSRALILSHLGESIQIKKMSTNILIFNPIGNGTNEINEALYDRCSLIKIDDPDPASLEIIFTCSRDVKPVGFDQLVPLTNRTLTADQKRIVLQEFKSFKFSIRAYKEIFWYLEHSPFALERLKSFFKRRIDLGLIELDRRTTQSELLRYDIPELFHKLELNEYSDDEDNDMLF